ncbi:AtuA-related protein [Halotalea alkalilenta]|uniref:AtuA-related protein n=1 Tax=Halotalea alkalilenta TaxID=376489 RepID=UPI0004810799|nr:hypothetical protein [Halotalea alkalilenta]
MNEAKCEVLLAELAHARAGDKGDILNIGVFVFDPADFDWLSRELSEERLRRHFAHRRPTRIERYPMPTLGGINLVLHGVLEGGVNASAGLDRHGKTLSYHLLSMRLPAPLPR